MKNSKDSLWSEEEIDILKEHYPSKGKSVSKKFTNKTESRGDNFMKNLLVNLKEEIEDSLYGVSVIEVILAILAITFGLFFVVSFIDILSNNMTGQMYHSWNFFSLMLRIFQ